MDGLRSGEGVEVSAEVVVVFAGVFVAHVAGHGFDAGDEFEQLGDEAFRAIEPGELLLDERPCGDGDGAGDGAGIGLGVGEGLGDVGLAPGGDGGEAVLLGGADLGEDGEERLQGGDGCGDAIAGGLWECYGYIG